MHASAAILAVAFLCLCRHTSPVAALGAPGRSFCRICLARRQQLQVCIIHGSALSVSVLAHRLASSWERLPLASRKVNTDLAVLGFRSSSSVPFLVGDGCAWNGRKPTTRELRSFSCLPWSAIDFHQTNKNLTRTLHAKARHHEMFVSALHTLGLNLDDWTVHDAEHWLCETRKVFQNSRHLRTRLTFTGSQASRVFGSDHDCPLCLPLYKPRAASKTARATVRGWLRHLHRLREREARIDRFRASLALECMPMTNAMLHFHV